MITESRAALDGTQDRRDYLGPVQVLCLAGLCAVGAELLAAYADNTGNVPAVLFALVFAATLPLALLLASDVLGESWSGVAFNATVIAVVGGLVWWRAQRPGWSVRHAAAVALAFLVSRGALAFTYFPLVGQVEPTAKYAHNAVMMLLIFMAGWFALCQQMCSGNMSRDASAEDEASEIDGA